MSEIRSWSPAGALPERAITIFLDATLREWSLRWSSSPILSVGWLLGSDHLHLKDRTSETVVRSESEEIWLKVSPAGSDLLARQLLQPPTGHELSQADKPTVDLFVGGLVEDLLLALERTLGRLQDRSGPAGGIKFGLVDHMGRDMATLELSSAAKARLISLALGRVRQGPSLSSRLVALADCEVTISARLGEAKLGLEAVVNLAEGDIVVLDRKIADGAELVAAGGRSFACAELNFADDSLGLTITRRI